MRPARSWAFALSLFLVPIPSSGSAQARSEGPALTICDDVQDPKTLDPHKEFTEKNHTLVQQIYEGLVRFDPEGKIEPALAVSWERIDPLRVRFHLRKGVRFHDGEPFDAEAVRFSIERYLDPKTGFPAMGFLSGIDKVEVVDATTADIVTKYPDGLLLNRLAGFVMVVPPAYIREKGPDALGEHPVGTGPFRFVRWDKGSQVVLSANPDYWMRGAPKVGRLVFRFLPEDAQLRSLFDGSVDVVTELPGTATTSVARAKDLRVAKIPTLYIVAASFNTNRGPLAKKEVREALNLAVNRDELIRYDILGNGRAIGSFLLKGQEGFEAERAYAHDPAKAKALLAKAGYPDGFTLKAACKRQGERAFRIISKQLEDLGVKFDAKYFSDAESDAVLAARDWDMMFGGCPDPMAHPFFIQSIFLYSKSPYSVATNPEYDALLERVVTTIDAAEREARIRELDRLVREQHLALPCYQRIKTIGYRKDVDFIPYVTGMPYLYSTRKGTHP